MNPFLLAGWIACQVFDGGSTYAAIHSGHFHEGNPLMNHKALYTLKVSVNIGGIVTYHQVAKTHKEAVLLPVGAMVMGCTAGTLNTYHLRGR